MTDVPHPGGMVSRVAHGDERSEARHLLMKLGMSLLVIHTWKRVH